jgi:N-acetylmuramoyl-L-alanine amidase
VSHPEEEALLMSGKFLDTLTEAVYKGIVDFLAPLGVNAQERP